MPRLTSRTLRFDFTVQMDPLSSQAEVSDLFRAILQDAKCKLDISGLEQSSFSCGVPEDGLAKVSGYLHVNKKFLLYEATVRKWITDDRIRGDIQWNPIQPGRNGDWKDDPLIKGASLRPAMVAPRSRRELGGRQLGRNRSGRAKSRSRAGQ